MNAQARRQIEFAVRQSVATVWIVEVAAHVERHNLTVGAVLSGDCAGGRSVVGPGDGDCQRGCRGSPLTVGCCVCDAGGPRLADGQIVEGRAGIERVAAVRVDRERAAVGADDARADIACDTVDGSHGQRVAVGIGVVGDHVARCRRVLGRGVRVGVGGRSGIRHGPDEGLRRGRAVRIGSRDRDAVRAADAGARCDRARDDAGRRMDAQARRQIAGAEGECVAAVRVGEAAADIESHDGAVVVCLSRNRRRSWSVVRAGDRDGESCRRSSALSVADRVADRGDARFAEGQIIERGSLCKRVRARRADVERPTGRTGNVRADTPRSTVDRADIERVAVGIGVVRADVAAGRSILGGGAAVVDRSRRGVRHGPREGLRRGHSTWIGSCNRDRVRSGHARVGRNRSRDDAGRRVDAQPRWQVRRAERERGACVGIAEVPRHVERDARAVGAVLSRDGRRCRRVVRAGHGHRHDGRVGPTLTVADRVADSCRSRFADGQIIERRAGVKRVRARRADRERTAVRTGDARPHIARHAVDRADGERVAVGIGVVGADVAGRCCVLGRGAAVVVGRRSRIGDVPREGLRSRDSGRIGPGDRDAVRAGDAGVGRDRPGDDAGRRMDAQAGRQICRAERQHVAAIGIAEAAGDIERHRLRIAVVLRRDRRRNRRVVRPRHSDRYRR